MEFLGHLAPPGDLLAKYDAKLRHTSQPVSQSPTEQLPSVFLDAMSVREAVFVDEQKCSLEAEFDTDDPRSWHWVCYASVATTGSSGPAVQKGFGASSKQDDRRRSTATASKLPVGVIRLVPPPHAPHPEPGSDIANAPDQAPRRSSTAPKTHEVEGFGTVDDDEPYIKLGRIAILPPYRKLGLAKLLVDAASQWASGHASDVVPKVEATARERAHVRQRSMGDILDGKTVPEVSPQEASPDDVHWEDKDMPMRPWKGLALVHAQIHLEKLYNKWGFVRDPSLGTWWEEGVEHIGMWKRLPIKEQR